MMTNLLTDEQLYKIKEKTEWDEEKRKWRIPAFVIKQKEIQLPKLGNARQFVQEELENQDVVLTQFSDSQATSPYQNNHNPRAR